MVENPSKPFWQSVTFWYGIGQMAYGAFWPELLPQERSAWISAGLATIGLRIKTKGGICGSIR